MTKLPRRGVLAASVAAPFLARHGFAQSDCPKGPVRWVVAFAAGGAADTVARTLSVRVSEIIGQQLIIENRTGGNSVVAANAAGAARRRNLPARRRRPRARRRQTRRFKA